MEEQINKVIVFFLLLLPMLGYGKNELSVILLKDSISVEDSLIVEVNNTFSDTLIIDETIMFCKNDFNVFVKYLENWELYIRPVPFGNKLKGTSYHIPIPPNKNNRIKIKINQPYKNEVRFDENGNLMDIKSILDTTPKKGDFLLEFRFKRTLKDKSVLKTFIIPFFRY